MDLDGKFSPPRLSFCTRWDPSGAEFVLLDTDDDLLPPSRAVEDRTGYEAVLNHVHLFSGPLPPEELAEVRALEQTFPGKRFAVFLTLNPEDGILRFHQLWPGEVPYYQVSGTVERDADALHTDIYAFYTGGAG